MVKIGSVTAEIFLTWTNVARTNVAWTNVIVTVGLCSKRSPEYTFKIWSLTAQILSTWTNVARTNVLVTVSIF